MSFSINTNVASLQAQNYLRVNSGFQQKTINRVTSGLRIVNSGDDAAGLAIANGMRSDEAVLTQGIQNANNGLSQLQIADGGMSNISQLLDRARTLATQSASGTFTGERGGLSDEFQNVLTEIDRQAQAIGLNQGGTFAKSLQVFIGGGKADATGSSSSIISNGSAAVDLSKSSVDTQSLGLKGFSAGYQVTVGSADSGLYDLGGSNTFTTVAAIVAAGSATATYVVTAPGVAGVTITANLTNVASTSDLVNAINGGITSAEQAGTAAAAALKAAGISATIHTGTDGHQQLQFTSSNTAFQVSAGNVTGDAFLGNFSAGQSVAGDNLASASTGDASATTDDKSAFVAKGSQQYTANFTTLVKAVQLDKQVVTFSINNSAGVPQTLAVTLDTGAGGNNADINATTAATMINAALQKSAIPALQSLVASAGGANDTLTFSSNTSSNFTATIGANTGATAGGGAHVGASTQGVIETSAVVGKGSTADISSQANAQVAVTALAAATAALGSAQATVGRGQNQFNYAINLAQSQLTNTQAAESTIRDADLAAESANLTKAQIMIQAGVAALAQANSAPQQVLSLLQR